MHHLQDIYSNHYLLDLVRSSFILTSMQRAKDEHKEYYGLLYHTVIILKNFLFSHFLTSSISSPSFAWPTPSYGSRRMAQGGGTSFS